MSTQLRLTSSMKGWNLAVHARVLMRGMSFGNVFEPLDGIVDSGRNRLAPNTIRIFSCLYASLGHRHACQKEFASPVE